MSVTIEEVMALAEEHALLMYDHMRDAHKEAYSDLVSARNKLRAALSALIAQARDEARAEYDVALRDVRNQARDEEAEAIFYDVCRAIPGLMMCDENGSPNIPYDKRAQVLDDIRARIAGRKA